MRILQVCHFEAFHQPRKIVTGGSIRLRILQVSGFQEVWGDVLGYRGFDPFEDTARTLAATAQPRCTAGYRGFDPFEDTAS